MFSYLMQIIIKILYFVFEICSNTFLYRTQYHYYFEQKKMFDFNSELYFFFIT